MAVRVRACDSERMVVLAYALAFVSVVALFVIVVAMVARRGGAASGPDKPANVPNPPVSGERIFSRPAGVPPIQKHLPPA
jgi:hypothetical protein